MPLEKTVLTETLIIDLLKKYYGLKIISVKRLKLGSANCYRVSDSEKSYFLKEFQSRFLHEDLIREARLVNFLADSGFPTARFILTVNGDVCFTYNEHHVCLQEFIDGKTYGNNDLPPQLLNEAAILLGKLNVLMKGYPLEIGMDKNWLDSFSPEKANAGYDELLAETEKISADKNCERIRSDLLYKKELSYRIADLRKYYDGVTYSASHGDYSEFQFICEGDHIKAVIDFSSAKILPVAWEIMRSFIQSSGACKNGERFNISAFCDYVKAYMSVAPLTKTDLSSMPYVYLHQLARSKYGYSQYLTTDSASRYALLDFAFWRTDICREIERCAHEISESLLLLSDE